MTILKSTACFLAISKIITPFTYTNKHKFTYNHLTKNIQKFANNYVWQQQNIAKQGEIVKKKPKEQHSNAAGGICCATTSAANSLTDEAAQALSANGAKQFHSFDANNAGDLSSVIATTIFNPLILYTSWNFWLETFHQEKKYKNNEDIINSHIQLDKQNHIFDANKAVALKHTKATKIKFKIEKHATSWVTALSAFLILLKFTTQGLLAAGLLVAAIKSFSKVIQRTIQIYQKTLDIHNNSKQQQNCIKTLQILNDIKSKFNNILEHTTNENFCVEFIQNKLTEIENNANDLDKEIYISNLDMQRYPKLKRHFFNDIKLYSLDGFFWSVNCAANLTMFASNVITLVHGIPLAATVTPILLSTLGVMYSNNKALTGKYMSGTTGGEEGKIKYQKDYSDYSLPQAEKEFDTYHDLQEFFKSTSKILNTPLSIKAKIFTTKALLKILMLLSFGTFADDIIRLKRKHRAYKAKLYKVSDKQLIQWIEKTNQIIQIHEHKYKYYNDNVNLKTLSTNISLTQAAMQFDKNNYIAKELAFNISKFKSNKIKKIRQISLQDFNNSTNKSQWIKNHIKDINEKDFVILKPYQKFIDLGLIDKKDIKDLFLYGTCGLDKHLGFIIEAFYENLDNLDLDENCISKETLKQNFEELIKQAAISTFAKAGLQYTRRYTSFNADIIAYHQNAKIVQEKNLKYNQQKLTNLAKRANQTNIMHKNLTEYNNVNKQYKQEKNYLEAIIPFQIDFQY